MIELPDIDTVPQKQCAKCLDWWPNDSEFYHREPRRPDGTSRWCKACFNAYQTMRRRVRLGRTV